MIDAQWPKVYNENTRRYEYVSFKTLASNIYFEDGETLQYKYQSGQLTGDTGPQGEKGNTGKSAYKAATDAGFTSASSELSWIAELTQGQTAIHELNVDFTAEKPLQAGQSIPSGDTAVWARNLKNAMLGIDGSGGLPLNKVSAVKYTQTGRQNLWTGQYDGTDFSLSFHGFGYHNDTGGPDNTPFAIFIGISDANKTMFDAGRNGGLLGACYVIGNLVGAWSSSLAHLFCETV